MEERGKVLRGTDAGAGITALDWVSVLFILRSYEGDQSSSPSGVFLPAQNTVRAGDRDKRSAGGNVELSADSQCIGTARATGCVPGEF